MGVADCSHRPPSQVISTNKRLTGEASAGHVSALQPRRALAALGPDPTYNGMIACPCTDRTPTLLRQYHVVQDADASDVQRPCAGVAAAVAETEKECTHAVHAIRWAQQRRRWASGPHAHAAVAHLNASAIGILNDPSWPPGCLVHQSGLFLNRAGPRCPDVDPVCRPAAPLRMPPPPCAGQRHLGPPLNAPLATAHAADRVASGAHTRPLQLCRDVDFNEGSVGRGRFQKSRCFAEPWSQVRAQNNPSCNISIYSGDAPLSRTALYRYSCCPPSRLRVHRRRHVLRSRHTAARCRPAGPGAA